MYFLINVVFHIYKGLEKIKSKQNTWARLSHETINQANFLPTWLLFKPLSHLFTFKLSISKN